MCRGKGICHQPCQLELDSWNPHGQETEQFPKLSPTSRVLQPITDPSLKTWTDYRAGQEPMAEEVECPREEPTTVILLNSHSILLPNKSCPYPIDQDSSWPSLQETLSNRELHINDRGMVSPTQHLYQPPYFQDSGNKQKRR